MTASIEITIDSDDPESAAAFWQAALGYRRLYVREPFIVLGPPAGDPRPRLLVQRVEAAMAHTQAVHLDLRVDDPLGEVRRLSELGASVRAEVDETDRGGSRWTVMVDPRGTVFCVCPAREE